METSVTKGQSPFSSSFLSLVRNPVKFNFFMLQKLPAAWFSGLKIKEITTNSCSISVPYKWFTKNPFHSIYFACLSMAAEMSTGILAMSAIYKRTPPISMLVTAVNSNYFKKATGTVHFVCNEGGLITEAIEKCIDLKIPQSIVVQSKGFNADNELVAEFRITWSFKVKS